MIASGNHLLTQVKNNQPGLRRKLELGSAGRKPSGCAKSETKGRNRWETRELNVFPAKAWFSRHAMGAAYQDRAAPGAHGLAARSRDRPLDAQTTRSSSGSPRLGPDARALE